MVYINNGGGGGAWSPMILVTRGGGGSQPQLSVEVLKGVISGGCGGS